MIASIRGNLIKKDPTEVVIEVAGIGYLCYISSNTYNDLGAFLDKEVFLLIYHQISENNQSLFGFSNNSEKELFLMLIGISGIGPKTAINLLSSVSANEFKKRLIAGEVKMLSSLPGIGPKTAKRIIIELKDKFVDSPNEELPVEHNEVFSDSFNALKSLGFNHQEINRCLNELLNKSTNLNTQDLIKESLKLLRKKT